jgi:hypothetical protein
MRAEILDEPELEFGGGSRHIDPRFGISNYGPADLGAPSAPRAIRVGLIGPADQLGGVRAWFERCRELIAAEDERYPYLFPEFPGCDIDRGLHTTLVFSDRNTRAISDRDLRGIAAASRAQALKTAVGVYAEEITALADENRVDNRVDVLLIARPGQLADTTHRPRYSPGRAGEPATVGPAPAAEAPGDDPALPQFTNFHDMLKARLLQVRQPIQIIRRSTWDESVPPPAGHSRQDEASRAWNLHVALYYKVGGVPWRLPRNSADLTTCYVGIAFYRNSGGSTLDTSVAQVFNERGDGVIVRVVLHKTSSFTAAEIGGFQGDGDERRLDTLELSWITSSEGARLFRPGAAPPLRGTLLTLGDREIVLYTKGSVEFYSTYPGMYVPQPIGIRRAYRIRSARDTGSETLALTKMNWNQTRLDGRHPVTIRTANQVKAILRFCAPDQAIATRYAHYM